MSFDHPYFILSLDSFQREFLHFPVNRDLIISTQKKEPNIMSLGRSFSIGSYHLQEHSLRLRLNSFQSTYRKIDKNLCLKRYYPWILIPLGSEGKKSIKITLSILQELG
jgi:hypothetical protein